MPRLSRRHARGCRNQASVSPTPVLVTPAGMAVTSLPGPSAQGKPQLVTPWLGHGEDVPQSSTHSRGATGTLARGPAWLQPGVQPPQDTVQSVTIETNK